MHAFWGSLYLHLQPFPLRIPEAVPSLPVPASRPRAGCGSPSHSEFRRPSPAFPSLLPTPGPAAVGLCPPPAAFWWPLLSVCLSVCLLVFLLCEDLEGCPGLLWGESSETLCLWEAPERGAAELPLKCQVPPRV